MTTAQPQFSVSREASRSSTPHSSFSAAVTSRWLLSGQEWAVECKRLAPRLARGGGAVLVAGLLGAGGWGVWCPASAWGQPTSGEAAATKPAGSRLIPAYAYDRGSNVVTCTEKYADAGPMVANLQAPTDCC